MSSGALFYIILDKFKNIEKDYNWEHDKVYEIKQIYDFSSKSFIYKEKWNSYLNVKNNDPLLFHNKEWIYFNTNIMDISSNIAELQECYKMGTNAIIYNNIACKTYNICEFKNDLYYPINEYIFHADISNDQNNNDLRYFKPEYGVLVYPKSHVFNGNMMYSEYDMNSFNVSIYPELNISLHEVQEYMKNKDYNTYTLYVLKTSRKRNILHNINSGNNIIFRVKRSLRFRDVFNLNNINELKNINELTNNYLNSILFYILDKTEQKYTLDDITSKENIILHDFQRLKVENNTDSPIIIQLHKYLFPEKIDQIDILKVKEEMKLKNDDTYNSQSGLFIEGKILNDAIQDIYDKPLYNDIFNTIDGNTTEFDLEKVKKEKKRFEKDVIKAFLKDVSNTELGLKVVKGKFLGKSTDKQENEYVIPKTNKIRKTQMNEYKHVYVPIDYDNPTMYYGPETFEYNGIEYENAIISIEMDKDEDFKYNGKIIKNTGKINELYNYELDEITLYFKENPTTQPGDNPFLFFEDVNGTKGISFEECKILPEMKYRLQNIDESDIISKKMKLSDRRNDNTNIPIHPKTDISGFDFDGGGINKGEIIHFKKRREDESIYIYDNNDITNTFLFPEYDQQTDYVELFIKQEEGYTIEIKQTNEDILFEIGSVTITVTDGNIITNTEMSANDVKIQLKSGDLSNVKIDNFSISNISFDVSPNNIHFLNSTIQGMDVSGIDLSGLTFDNSTNITGVIGEPTNIALGYSVVDGRFYNRLIFEKVDISYMHYDVKIERNIWKLNNIETPLIYLKQNISYQVDFSGSIDNSFDIFYSREDLSDSRFPFGGSIANSNNMYDGVNNNIIMTDTSNAYYGHKTIHGMGGLQYHNIKVHVTDEPLFGYPINRQSSSQINDTSMNNMFSVSKKLCYDFDVQYQRLKYNELCQFEPKREICINGYLRPKLIINDNSYIIFEITNVYTPIYPDPDLSLDYVEKFNNIGLHNAPLTREDIITLIDISNGGTDISGVENITHWQYSSLIQLFNEKVFENKKFRFDIISSNGSWNSRTKIVDISGIIDSYSTIVTYPLYIGIDWKSITISNDHIYITYEENNMYGTGGSSIELSNNNIIIPEDMVVDTTIYEPSGISILYSIYIASWFAHSRSGSSYKINPNLTHNVFDTINNYVDGFIINDSISSRVMAMWGGNTLTSLLSSFPFEAYIGTKTYYYFDMSYTYDIYQLIYNPSRNELLQLTNEIKEIINANNNINNIDDIFKTEYEIPEMSNYSKSNLLDLLILANNKKEFFTKNDKNDKYIDISDVLFGEKIVNKYGNFDIYTYSEFEKQKELYDISTTNKPEHFSNMLGDTYIIGPINLIYSGIMRDMNNINNWSTISVSNEKLDDICIKISRKRIVKSNKENKILDNTNMLYYISRDINDISVNDRYSYEIKQYDKHYRFKLSQDKTYYDVYEGTPKITNISFIYELLDDNIISIDNSNIIYNNMTLFNLDICYNDVDDNTNQKLYKRDLFTTLNNNHIVEFDGNSVYLLNYYKKIGSTNNYDFSINVIENELYLFQMLYNDSEKNDEIYEHAPIIYPYKKNGDIQYYYDINYIPKIGDPFKTNRIFHARKLVQYGDQAISDKYYLSTFRHSIDICYNGHEIDNVSNEYHSELSISGSYDYDIVLINETNLILTKNNNIQRIPIQYILIQGSHLSAIKYRNDWSSYDWLKTEDYTGSRYTTGTITHMEVKISSDIYSEYDVSTNVLGFVYINNNYEENYMNISDVSNIANDPNGLNLLEISTNILFNIESSYNRIDDMNILDPNMFIIRSDTSYNFKIASSWPTSISHSINGYNLNIIESNNVYSFHTPNDFSDNIIITTNNQDISDIILKSVNDDWKYTSPGDFSGCVINILDNVDISKNLIVERKEYDSNSEEFIIKNSSHFNDDFDLI